MKKLKSRHRLYIALIGIWCLLCGGFQTLHAQQKNQTDHHIHLFSPQLLTQLKSHKYGSDQFKGNDFLYTNIDTIVKLNNVENICLISTGYAFRQPSENKQAEIRQQLEEQNYLSNAALKYPSQIKPFYGVNPLKPYALQLIKRAHQHLNFSGIKLHFHASHIDFRKSEHVDALIDIFTYTGQHKIPVLIHFQNHKSDFAKTEVDYFFNYILPKKLPQNLMFAHLGGGGWMTEKSILILEALQDNQHKYKSNHKIKFEISGILSDQFREYESISDERKAEVLRRIGFNNLLFGSDYPLIDSNSFFDMLVHRLKLSSKEIRTLKRNRY